ncbi:MAG: hypothetical protein A2157_13330 [Deltaproteobacteria bacterium RBG_16_47_11]|nr:MAG: hypothetical protein A2157_13330 [Deltaproteobacteria bacterium RBG_16_47_11]
MKSSQRFLRLILLIFLSFNLNLILFLFPAFAQFFTITNFHADITIHSDSSFNVRETIDVKFDRPRHGIYREIPFKYRDEFGRTLVTPIRVTSVKDGTGKAWRYKVEKHGSILNIRIGHPKQYVGGNQTYVITYQVENAILFFKDHDELYWNVTGNYWKAPILDASADVSLAVKEKSKNIMAAGYTGRWGSKESECEWQTYDNGGKCLTKRRLAIGEGLTIAFGWDKGLISPPSSWQRFLWTLNIRENWVFVLPIFSFIFMFNHWYRRGRDPKVREALVVQYGPPKFDNQPLTPAEVGALIDEKLDPKDITSTIVGLAVKGYLQIEETKQDGLFFNKTDYYLKRVKVADSTLSPFEIELMKSLLPGNLPGTLVSGLKNKFYTNLPILKKTLYGELTRKRYFLTNPENVRNSYRVIGVLMMVFGSFALLFLLSPDSLWKSIFAAFLMGVPVLALAKFMPAKTKSGALAYMDILGFQEFMDRTEKDKIERMGDMNLFSKYLPYAIALDVADNWAKAFEGIYQDPPDWYVSPGGFRTFTPYAFVHSMNSVTSNLSSAMFSAPRGSDGGGGGFGGGGSSGGGFGGGGGGSW